MQTRTTWKFRVSLVALVWLVGWLSSGWLSVAIANSLVCDADAEPSDAILIENFDPTYLAFETAARLRRAGIASRVIVPVGKNATGADVNPVGLGTAQLMANIARLGPIEVVPIGEVEPIALNAAWDVLRFIDREHIRSVIVVTPLFRSQRSALVYAATLGRAGITVGCEPVRAGRQAENWTRSWHGVQDVAEQWTKLQYYRLYVLPFRLTAQKTADRILAPK